MVKRFAVALVLLALVFGGVIGFKLYKQAATREYLATMEAPPVHVNGAVATSAQWDQHLAAIGSLRSRRGIDIRSEVSGVIAEVHVSSAQGVSSGDLLATMDDRVERAALKSANARLDEVRRTFERDSSLFERGLVSEGQFDASRSAYQSAEGQVEELKGIIDRKSFRAPFAGRLGIHNLTRGQYLEPGDLVAPLHSLDELYLDLYLPEKELASLSTGQQVIFTVPSQGEREFEAEIQVIDVLVQGGTRNVLVRAVVDNNDELLRPGMFASAIIVLNEQRAVVTVPREAVAFSLYGETVYLLQQTGAGGWSASRRVVTSGEVRGTRVALEGLEPGQIIALDTQHRLLEGTPVIIENLATLTDGGAATD